TLPPPGEPDTFTRCKVDQNERAQHPYIVALHRDLLRLRREEIYTRDRRLSLDGAVLSDRALILRWFSEQQAGADSSNDRLLIVNLGTELSLTTLPEPLLAPPEGLGWEVSWSSDDPAYGGVGTAPVENAENWTVPGRCAVVLAPRPL